MLLYEHPLSSYAQKIKIALREKGLPFEARTPEDLGTGKADGPLAKANPRIEVPVLIDEPDVRIFESTIILEYIEERWPEPRLLPRRPAARAFARETEEICDTQYEALNWGWSEVLWFRRAEGELARKLEVEVRRQTRLMQDWLAARLGDADWFGGEQFGWADAAAAPMVNRSVHYGFAPPVGSSLARWHSRIRERASVAQTFAEFDQALKMMGANPDRYRGTGAKREYRDHRLEWMIKSGGVEVVLAGLRDGNIRFTWPGNSGV